MTRPQLDALTGARGLAAWLVVLYHIRAAFPDSVPPLLIDFFAKGYLAVDLFFILSGFVMWLTYGARFATEGLRAAPDFLKRRIARVYPLHFCVLLVTIGFALLLEARGHPNADQYPWRELPLHFLLVQNWGFTDRLSWNDPSWSISTEFAAYLMLPFAALALNRLKLTPPLLIVAILILCLALDQFFVAHGATTLGSAIPANGLLRCLAQFLCGMLVCQLWQKRERWMVAASALVLIGCFGLWQSGIWRESFAVPLGFAALVFWLAATSGVRGNPLGGRVLRYVGDISYSTYLAHFPLWIGFKLVFVSDVNTVSLPLMALFLLLVLGSSALLYQFVEQPGRRWLQGFGKEVAPRAKNRLVPKPWPTRRR